MSSSHEITHIIFDFDGVIVDTEKTYSVANDAVLQTFGRSFNNTLKNGMMGRKKTEAVQWILQQTGIADHVTVEQFNEIYDKQLMALLPNAPVLPGAVKLIEYFRRNNFPLAICTGSNTEEFELKSRNIQPLLKNFDFFVLAGDDVEVKAEVKAGKPAPDAYLVTMKRFPTPPKMAANVLVFEDSINGVRNAYLVTMKRFPTPPKMAANVLVFEDSINGVRSSLAAGCQTVFIPQDEFKTHDWEERIADIKPLVETLSSLEEFKPEKYGLPSF
uniref:Uncharacterized protein n=1 Tax=Panagrolaimus sp. PS1159 TaxID=55785 RepID=A0AC35FUR3_9BILA